MNVSPELPPVVFREKEIAPPSTSPLAEISIIQATAPLPRQRFATTMTLLGMTILAFAWRLVGLTEQSLWRDEIDVIYLALRPLSETASMFISPAQNGPLYYFFIRLWVSLTGSSEFALRYSSVLFGTLAILLFWQTARRLLPSSGRLDWGNVPLLATLLLAFNPYQVWYSQEGKMYALVMCTALLSCWSWIEAMRLGGRGRWFRYLILTTLSIYTHLMTALLLPLHLVWFMLCWPLNKTRWRGYLATLSGFVLPYVPLVWWQWHYLTSLDYQSGYRFTPFAEVLRILLLDHTRGALVSMNNLWLIPLFFLGLAGVLVGYSEIQTQASINHPSQSVGLLPVRGEFRMAMIVAWLVVPVLLLHGVSLIKPVFVDRYVIWIASAVAMIVALGLQVMRHSHPRWGTLLAGILLSYTLVLWGWTSWQQTYTPNKTQLRQAITYVNQSRQAGELLILQIPHTHYAYRYYTSDFGDDPFADSDARLHPWTEGLWTHNALSDTDASLAVDQMMQQRTDGFDRAWVVLVESTSWDPRRLMEIWLDTQGELLDRQLFHGIEVRHYQLPE